MLVASALAACDSGGLEIVVYGPSDPGTPAPKTVKLYIGHGTEVASSIAPAPMGTARFTAPRWTRMPDNVDDTAEMVDGVATFVFRSGGDVTGFPIVVAVGFDAQGVPTSSAAMFDLQLGNARVRSYSVGLNKAADPVANRSAFNGLVLWGPSSKAGRDDACVFVQNTYPDPESRSAFIITEGDRDCDGFPDDPAPPECLADVWNGVRAPKRDELTCLTTRPASNGGAYCLGGGPACVDGGGTGAAVCAESRYCAHEALCTPAVCGIGQPGWMCAKDVSAATTGMNGYPSIACTFYFTIDSASGAFAFCPGDATFDLVNVGLPASPTCSQVRVRNTMQGFGDKLVDGPVDYKVAVDSTCKLAVTPEGIYPPGTTPREGRTGLLAVELGSAMRGLLMPIGIAVMPSTVPGQCAPPSCHFDGQTPTTIKSCLALPLP